MREFIVFLLLAALVSVAASQDMLKPGESRNYTAQYTVGCSDIVNNAAVHAKGPCSSFVNAEDSTRVKVVYRPDIEFKKVSDKSDEKVDVGDIINYYYQVKNTGDVPLLDIVIVDDMVGMSAINGPIEAGGGNGDALLDPGETWTYRSTYHVRTEDLCHKLVNWAELTARDPCKKLITMKARAEVETICAECCQDRLSVEDIDLGIQRAISLQNGEAKNNVKIITDQGGSG